MNSLVMISLQAHFSRQYEYLHYRWFSQGRDFLEQGLIGLILTVLFFVSIALAIIKRFKMKKVYTLAAFSFIPTCIIGLLYNSALELEATYMIALVCAFPFILKKRNNEMAVKKRIIMLDTKQKLKECLRREKNSIVQASLFTISVWSGL